MKRFFFSLVVLVVMTGVVMWVYLLRSGVMAPGERATFDTSNVMSADFEEKLVYFLVTKLNLFEGNFQVINVMGLNVGNLVGQDFVLITLRGPDGNIYQVTARRSTGARADWEFDEGSFHAVNLATYVPSSPEEEYGLLGEEGGDPGKNKLYAQLAAPGEFLEPGRLAGFEGEGSGLLLQSAEIAGKSNFDLSRNKRVMYSNRLVAGPGPDAMWVTDYPKDVVGPGYRSYLYQKMKGQR
ncbi:MAG: hypothetical protein PHT59_04605 [Candidatus Omnitrophica bacterium]|nr:hypothetical protein [Candidatus Omnitrophota bacterium]